MRGGGGAATFYEVLLVTGAGDDCWVEYPEELEPDEEPLDPEGYA
jgi:hypothetical protein